MIMGFKLLPEVFWGAGSLKQLADVLRNIKAEYVLVVTDQGIVKAGIADKVISVAKEVCRRTEIFDQIEPDPKDTTVAACAAKYKNDRPDAIVAVGGGSCMDFGKAVNVLLYNDGTIQDYKNQWDAIPNLTGTLVTIPTTAGTGSELTDFAVISDTSTQQKVNLIGKSVVATQAIVDPELTVGLPAGITAATGMDALTHAIESYACKTPNDLSDMLSLKAVSLIYNNLKTCVVDDPTNIEARSAVMMGSMLAGCSFANALLGLVHGIAHPLGAVWHVPHGVANAFGLPYVLEYEIPSEGERIINVGRAMGLTKEDLQPEDVIVAIKELMKAIHIPMMSEYGVKEDDLDRLADLTMQEMGYICNPVQPSKEELVEILKKMYVRA